MSAPIEQAKLDNLKSHPCYIVKTWYGSTMYNSLYVCSRKAKTEAEAAAWMERWSNLPGIQLRVWCTPVDAWVKWIDPFDQTRWVD
jgi:hypothetical protein